MNFLFFIYMPLVHSASHIFMTTYTRLQGQKVAGTSEISAKTTLDGEKIDYYDSDTGAVIPTQDWMKEFASGDKWKNYTETRERVQNIKNQFTQSHGVHDYQRKYGCDWDDQTEDSHGFDKYSYDGQPFISLDLNEGRYTAHAQKAELTVQQWNSDSKKLDFLKQYYQHDCIYWMKELLNFSNAKVKKTIIGSEQLQKNLTVDDTESNGSTSHDLYACVFVILGVCAVFCFLYLCWKHRDELKSYCKKFKYYKSSSEKNEAEPPLLQPTTLATPHCPN